MASKEITQGNVHSVLDSNEIVLIDFWASWCGPCRMFGPIYEKVSSDYPDIVFGKVNTEAEQELAGAFRIMSIPTVMAFRQGILVYSQSGAMPEEALHQLIHEIRSLDMEEVKLKVAENEASGSEVH